MEENQAPKKTFPRFHNQYVKKETKSHFQNENMKDKRDHENTIETEHAIEKENEFVKYVVHDDETRILVRNGTSRNNLGHTKNIVINETTKNMTESKGGQ